MKTHRPPCLFPVICLFFSFSAWCTPPAQLCFPIKKIPLCDDDYRNVQVGRTIYADKSDTLDLETPLARFSGSCSYEALVIATDGSTVKCSEAGCFESGDPDGSAESSYHPYVFAERLLNGKQYANVRFWRNDMWTPAWIHVPEGVLTWEIEKTEIDCYMRRRQEIEQLEKKIPELLPVSMNSPITIDERFSVTDGSWAKRIRLDRPAILAFSLPDEAFQASEWLEYYLSVTALSDTESKEESGNVVDLIHAMEKGKPYEVLVPPGLYQMRLQASPEEGDSALFCRLESPVLTVLATDPDSATKKAFDGAITGGSQKLVNDSKFHAYKTVLTKLSPELLISAELSSVTLVDIQNIERTLPVKVRAEFGRLQEPYSGSTKEITGEEEHILTGAGTIKIHISSAQIDELGSTEFIPVSFSVSIQEGKKSSYQLFEPTWAPDASFPGAAVQFRNISGLDLEDVRLAFDYYHILGHYKGSQNVPVWKKDGIQTFNFLDGFPRSITGSTDMKIEVQHIGNASVIEYHLANPYFETMKGLPQHEPSEEYEKQIKLKVFKYCGEIDPAYSDAFKSCQNRWLKEESACRRIMDARQPGFIDCVRSGIERNFPELLPRLEK